MSGQYWKKWFKKQNLLYGFLKKCNGSLNNPSRANGDFREQIYARDSNNSGETEEVVTFTIIGTCNGTSYIFVPLELKIY